MSDFKEALAFEAKWIFLNPEEFGEPLLVDGVETIGLWGESTQPAPDLKPATVDAWGLNTDSAMLCLPENAITLPVVGQELNVNGEAWTVRKARVQTGIIRLELERNSA